MTISSNINKTRQNGNGVTTSFPFNFSLMQNDYSDLFVYQIDIDPYTLEETSTLLALGTDYSITPTKDIDNRITGGYINTIAPLVLTSNQDLFAIRVEEITQETELNIGIRFPEKVIENQLDTIVAIEQQIKEEQDRSIKINKFFDGTLDLNIPNPIDGRTLKFKDNSGSFTMEISDTNPDTVYNDIITNANVIAIGNDLNGANTIGTVATNIADVNNVSTNISDITNVSNNMSDINGVSNNMSDINDIITNITDINDVADNLISINAVDSDLTNINAVYNDLTNIDNVATDLTNIDTVSTNIANINSVASDLTNINNVASDLTNINSVASDLTNINTNATNIASINTNATNIADINTVASNISTIAVSSLPVGSLINACIPIVNAGLHLTDGGVISSIGTYSAFATYLNTLVSTYPNLFTDEATWQSTVSTYGQCCKFVIDSGANTIRLPLIKGIVHGTNTLADLGNLTAQGRQLVKTYSSGQAWYRIYSDGWIEQGNVSTVSSASVTTINLLQTMNDTNYSVSVTMNHMSAQTASGVSVMFGGAFSTSQIKIVQDYTGDNYGTAAFWVVRGYGAIPTTFDLGEAQISYYLVIGTSVKTDIVIDIDQITNDLSLKAEKTESYIGVATTGNQDLNTFITSGYRFIGTGTHTNTPASNTSGFLEVFKATGGTTILQKFVESGASSKLYSRYYSGSAWSTWSQQNSFAPSSRYVDITLGASGSTYTAPADGYVNIAGTTAVAGGYVGLENQNSTPYKYIRSNTGTSGNTTLGCMLPVKKGDVTIYRYASISSTYFQFIYSEGAKND